MKQYTIQEKESLLNRLEKFSPLWVKKIRKTKFEKIHVQCKVNGQKLDLDDYPTCVMGEAHLFEKVTVPYTEYVDKHGDGCLKCHELSMAFGNHSPAFAGGGDTLRGDENVFYKVIGRTVRHLETKHHDLISERKARQKLGMIIC